MRHSRSVLLSGLALLAISVVAAAQDAASLRGRVVIDVATCCGGARIEPGRACTAREAYTGEVTFRRGRRNRGRAVARVTTDDAGRFRVSLPAGTYCVGVADRAFSDDDGMAAGSSSAAADSTCLDQRRLGCDAIVTVPRSGSLTVRTARPCFGHCYSGPMPP